MSYKKLNLSKQLFYIIVIVFVIFFISIGIILPKTVIPVAEKNIYSYLSEPLKLMQSDFNKELTSSEVAYLYIINDKIVNSDNLSDVLEIENTSILKKYLTNDYGKFIYKHKTYYYYKVQNSGITRIALTGDSYIRKTKESILNAVIPIILIMFLLIGMVLILWSTMIVLKIDRLKQKVDNIDREDYNHKINFKIDDEIKSLGLALEDMRISLKDQEEYRNQMYQNISHDFKTPLTVIKSYVEAVQDGVEDENTALKVIGEQTNKLEQKVHSLLYLNKLDYLKDSKDIKVVAVDMKKILEDEISKFKFQKKDIKFILDMDKRSKYYGTVEHWETILDNLLGNFMRYANTTIKIIAKNNKIILFNDGDNIDDDLLNGIFTPFRKGIKGQFGLGLSIVKKTLNIIGYDIVIKNEKKGVSFIITRGIHR